MGLAPLRHATTGVGPQRVENTTARLVASRSYPEGMTLARSSRWAHYHR